MRNHLRYTLGDMCRKIRSRLYLICRVYWLLFSLQCCYSRSNFDHVFLTLGSRLQDCLHVPVAHNAVSFQQWFIVAPEFESGWWAPVWRKSGGTDPAPGAGNFFGRPPSTLFVCKSTVSRFNAFVMSVQFGHAVFFACLLLIVPPCAQPFLKVGGTCPHLLWNRCHWWCTLEVGYYSLDFTAPVWAFPVKWHAQTGTVSGVFLGGGGNWACGDVVIMAIVNVVILY